MSVEMGSAAERQTSGSWGHSQGKFHHHQRATTTKGSGRGHHASASPVGWIQIAALRDNSKSPKVNAVATAQRMPGPTRGT